MGDDLILIAEIFGTIKVLEPVNNNTDSDSENAKIGNYKRSLVNKYNLIETHETLELAKKSIVFCYRRKLTTVRGEQWSTGLYLLSYFRQMVQEMILLGKRSVLIFKQIVCVPNIDQKICLDIWSGD